MFDGGSASRVGAFGRRRVNRRYLHQLRVHVAGDVSFLGGGVLPRFLNCEAIPIYPDDSIEFVQERLCEETAATVGVDQQLLIRWHHADDQLAKRLGHGVVSLSENARTSTGAQRIMTITPRTVPQLCQLPVHFILRDRAALDI